MVQAAAPASVWEGDTDHLAQLVFHGGLTRRASVPARSLPRPTRGEF
jgi:hypothetical protein